MNAADDAYTLDELSAEAAKLLADAGLLSAQADPRVSAAPDARTVRYYTTLGLLDRPAIVGRQARYGARHVQQLLAIKALQAAGLPLAQIQERLFGRSQAELARLVESLAQKAQAARHHKAQIAAAPPALMLREIAVAPGVRLQIEEGFAVEDVDALLENVRVALQSLQSQSGARGAQEEA